MPWGVFGVLWGGLWGALGSALCPDLKAAPKACYKQERRGRQINTCAPKESVTRSATRMVPTTYIATLDALVLWNGGGLRGRSGGRRAGRLGGGRSSQVIRSDIHQALVRCNDALHRSCTRMPGCTPPNTPNEAFTTCVRMQFLNLVDVTIRRCLWRFLRRSLDDAFDAPLPMPPTLPE